MSDIPPTNIVLPTIPDDVLYDIFLRCDYRSLCRCMSLSRMWKSMLCNPEFLKNHSLMSNGKDASILAHFSYPVWRMRNHWLTQLGEVEGVHNPLHLPVHLNTSGWFSLVGAENGNLCIRCSIHGRLGDIIVWNPLTGKMRQVHDPVEHRGCLSVFIYAFGYLRKSFDYRIIHIFKRKYRDTQLWYTFYCSASQTWSLPVQCDDKVSRLGPKSVVIDGIVYWIKWSSTDIKEPYSVISFNLQDLCFGEVLIPTHCKSDSQNLIKHHDKLGFLSFDNSLWNSKIDLWHVISDGTNGARWDRIFSLTGFTFHEIPYMVIDDDVLMVEESNTRYIDAHDVHLTEVVFSKVNYKTNSRRMLHSLSWNEDVDLKSVTLFDYGVFPV